MCTPTPNSHAQPTHLRPARSLAGTPTHHPHAHFAQPLCTPTHQLAHSPHARSLPVPLQARLLAMPSSPNPPVLARPTGVRARPPTRTQPHLHASPTFARQPALSRPTRLLVATPMHQPPRFRPTAPFVSLRVNDRSHRARDALRLHPTWCAASMLYPASSANDAACISAQPYTKSRAAWARSARGAPSQACIPLRTTQPCWLLRGIRLYSIMYYIVQWLVASCSWTSLGVI